MRGGKRDPRFYLQDIVAAVGQIEQYSARGKQEFLTDSLLQDGVIRQTAVIGEASARLPRGLTDQYPGIPWKQIIGMWNIYPRLRRHQSRAGLVDRRVRPAGAQEGDRSEVRGGEGRIVGRQPFSLPGSSFEPQGRPSPR